MPYLTTRPMFLNYSMKIAVALSTQRLQARIDGYRQTIVVEKCPKGGHSDVRKI